MKYKLKNDLKLLALGLMLLVAFNCEKDELTAIEAPENNSPSYKVTSLEKLGKLIPVIDNIKRIEAKAPNTSRGLDAFLSLENLDTNNIIQYTDATGFSTYTLKINNANDTSINFENLHLLETEDGYIAYILSYEPEASWYTSDDNYTPKGEWVFNIAKYQGHITKYSLDRQIIWSTNQDKVSNTDTTSNRGGWIEVCTISLEYFCDYGDSPHPAGPNCTGEITSQSVETCVGTYVGGGGGSTNTPSNPNDPTNPGEPTGGGVDGGNAICNSTGTSIVGTLPLSVATGCTPNVVTGIAGEEPSCGRNQYLNLANICRCIDGYVDDGEGNCVVDMCSPLSISSDLTAELEAAFGVGNILPTCNEDTSNYPSFDSIDEIEAYLDSLLENNFATESSVMNDPLGSLREDIHVMPISDFPEASLVASIKVNVPDDNNALECLEILNVDTHLEGNNTYFDWSQYSDTDISTSNGGTVTINEGFDTISVEVRGEFVVGFKAFGEFFRTRKLITIKIKYFYSTGELDPNWSYWYYTTI